MLKLLLVEDSETDAALLVRSLRKAGYEIQHERVETAGAMQTALGTQPWDVVISDYSLPEFNAEAALALLQATGRDIPFIVVSGTMGEDTAVAMLKAGAHDYLLKDRLSRLAPAVERELKEAKNRQEQSLAEQALRESEARFSTVFQSSPISIAITRLGDEQIVDVNAAWEKTTGFLRSEAIGRKPLEMNSFVDPGDWQRLTELLRKQNMVQNYEFRIRHKSGAICDLLMSAEIVDLSGEPCVLSTAQDITEHKHAEGRVKRQVEYLNALREIDKVITSSFNLRISLDFILKQAVTVLAVDAADILLFNPFDRSLEYAAGYGLRTPVQQRSHLRMGQGYAGKVALEQRRLIIHNMSVAGGDFMQSHLPANENIVFYYGLPLIAKGQVKGVLEIMHRSPIHLDEDWKNFLEMLVSQAAIAIDSLELFEKIQRLNLDLVLAYDTTLEGLGRALDYRQRESEGHTQRVTEMALGLAQTLGMGENDQVSVRRGALLHDIGMLTVPEGIFLKPESLSEEERGLVRQHTHYAHTWLSQAAYLRSSLDIPTSHHEQWDGNGYPRQLNGENIPMAARLFTVVHMWDVLQSDRPYRKAWPREKVVQFLWQQSGVLFDPLVLKAFFDTFKETRF
jgi:PAS domain S-box-containing protein